MFACVHVFFSAALVCYSCLLAPIQYVNCWSLSEAHMWMFVQTVDQLSSPTSTNPFLVIAPDGRAKFYNEQLWLYFVLS